MRVESITYSDACTQPAGSTRSNASLNKLDADDMRIHDWYRFVLSFPAHLVREYVSRFDLDNGDVILDPFCGTGTTIVEAMRQGVSGIGIEANPMAYFASSVKIDRNVDPDALLQHANTIAQQAQRVIEAEDASDLRVLPDEMASLLIKNSISPMPLHKTLVLLEQIKLHFDARFHRYELLALAKTSVFSSSNLRFGPEVGVSKKKKTNAPVIESWLSAIDVMCADLRRTQSACISAVIHHADARSFNNLLKPKSIDAVFTSPPYPNEKDYTRTTRLESVLLGFISNKKELQSLKRGLLRSNTRNVYKGDADDRWVSDNAEIQSLASRIEARRIELGKTSGFEKLYARVTKLYFGGMARHLAELRPYLKPGAYLGYVVGDQASYLQVMIHTGQLLGDIAQRLGYQLESIDLFRTRQATVTKNHLREEVVVLRWPG